MGLNIAYTAALRVNLLRALSLERGTYDIDSQRSGRRPHRIAGVRGGIGGSHSMLCADDGRRRIPFSPGSASNSISLGYAFTASQ